jgi:hypothetical protein
MRYQRTPAFAPPGPATGLSPPSPGIFSPGTVAAAGCVLDSVTTSVFEAQEFITKTRTNSSSPRRPTPFITAKA